MSKTLNIYHFYCCSWIAAYSRDEALKFHEYECGTEPEDGCRSDYGRRVHKPEAESIVLFCDYDGDEPAGSLWDQLLACRLRCRKSQNEDIPQIIARED